MTRERGVNADGDAKGSLAVELRGLAKAFGAVVACRNVSLSVAKGSIHGIIGENGAGKSTAMNILYGLLKADCGEILVDGTVRTWRSPRDAVLAGIGMVHQHFMLAGQCSALDNVILGAEPTPKRWQWLPHILQPVDRRAARARLEEIAAAHHMPLSLDTQVDALPVGLQQRLEILKLLYRDCRVLILDEPTAVLTPAEVSDLFRTLRRLRDDGRSIILITHKLREVLSLADTLTVMRHGEVVGHVSPRDVNEEGLAEMMVGRTVSLSVPPPPPPALKEDVLRLSQVNLGLRSGRPKLSKIDLAVAGGEIVGIAGVDGNGQTELYNLLCGPREFFRQGKGGFHSTRLAATGEMRLLGYDGRGLDNAGVRALGVGMVPGDRHRQAMVVGFDLAANFLLGRQRQAPYAKAGILQKKPLKSHLVNAMETYDVRPAEPEALAGSLSGGNQQKIVMARELENHPRLLLCAQPTRGVDVGAIEFIHQRLLAARNAGCGILLISSELSEILALSDRILVMYEGHIVATYARGEADEKTLGRHMGGARGAAGEAHGT